MVARRMKDVRPAFGQGPAGRRLALALLAAASLSTGLAAEARCEAPSGPVTVKTLPPPDLAANALQQQQEYVIGPLDTLEITVFQEQNLGGVIQVDANGNITLPLVGTMRAAAKTPTQLGDELAVKLGDKFLQSPQVRVVVKTSVSQRYTVSGAVAKPGVFDAVGRTTLLQAVANAQGVTEFANDRNVVVFRTVDKRRVAAVVSLADIQMGRIDDPEIYPGDVIVVSSSKSRKALHDIVGLTPLFFFLRP